MGAAAGCFAAWGLSDTCGVGDHNRGVRGVHGPDEWPGFLNDMGETVALAHDGEGGVQND